MEQIFFAEKRQRLMRSNWNVKFDTKISQTILKDHSFGIYMVNDFSVHADDNTLTYGYYWSDKGIDRCKLSTVYCTQK